MTKDIILALDQGTTGSRAICFNARGKMIGSAYKEFPQYFPRPGWVEHDADEIWKSCASVIRAALKKARVKPERIRAIGITNQRETTVVWDRKTSKPLARAIVWQCRRTADICARPSLRQYGAKFHRATGLVLDPYFSGTKIKWLLDHVPGLRAKARAGRVCFGTIDSWLIWKLTGGQSHATDYTNASRTLLFNIRRMAWDKDLCRILTVPMSMLPEALPSGGHFGETVRGAGLPAGIPITAVLGDQQAALYGQGCTKAGMIKNTYGTGCFIVLNTGKTLVRSKHGLLTTVAADFEGRPVYALEGSIFMAGAVIQWLRDQVGVIKSSADSERIIKKLKDTHGVYIVPAFAGLGAPYWNSDARGIICGLTRGATSAHLTRAALESIAYRTRDVIDVMAKDTGLPIRSLKVDGGASQNNFLMQFQSDILSRRIIRPANIESTALGAAQLAGVSSGLWRSAKDLESFAGKSRTFVPRMSKTTRTQLYNGWLAAVKKA